MKLLTINDVGSDWKKVINFADETFLLVDAKQIKTLVSEQEECYTYERLRFLHNGNFLTDEVLLHTLISATDNVLNLNLIQISASLMNLVDLSSLEFDTVSVNASTKWAADDSSTNDETTELKKIVNALSVNDVNIPARAAAPAEPAIRWVQFSLLLRLVVSCFVFCYNKNMTVVSQAAMGGLALTIYLFHIGAARLWVRMGFRYLMREFFHLDHNNMIIDPINPVNAAPAVGAPVNARPFGARPAAGHNMTRTIQRIIETISKLAKEGVVVPVGPGLHNDVLAVVVSLVGSLFPQWTPTGAPILTWD